MAPDPRDQHHAHIATLQAPADGDGDGDGDARVSGTLIAVVRDVADRPHKHEASGNAHEPDSLIPDGDRLMKGVNDRELRSGYRGSFDTAVKGVGEKHDAESGAAERAVEGEFVDEDRRHVPRPAATQLLRQFLARDPVRAQRV